MRRIILCLGASIPCLVAPAARAEEAPAKGGEVVLLERSFTTQALGKSHTTAYIVPATVVSRQDGKVTVTYEDGTQEARPEADAKQLDWAPGQSLLCRALGKPTADFTNHKLVAVEGANVKVNPGYGEDKTYSIMLCRQKHPFGWWMTMSPYYKDFAKYKLAKSAPVAKRKDPAPGEIQRALDYQLQGADGGAYIQIKSCVAAGGAWNMLENAATKRHTAREIPVACTVAVPLPPKPKENFQCLVLHGVCRQNYVGVNKYSACQYSTAVDRDPERIACPKK
jgi:hypothetical protein